MKRTLIAALLMTASLLAMSCTKPSVDEDGQATPAEQPQGTDTPEAPEDNGNNGNSGNSGNSGNGGSTTASGPAVEKTGAKTIVVWYSYTGNTKGIVAELRSQRKADALEIQPAEEGLDYAANNYAMGSALISAIKAKPNDASSYPSIKVSEVDFTQYDTVIVATPLWWSQMAAPMQSFLFKHGSDMSSKTVGLIVSSHSSGISSVESDARRLVSSSKFLPSSLWINNSNLSNKASLIKDWLSSITPSTSSTGTMKITVGTNTVTATLVENTATAKLKEMLSKGAITYSSSDNGFETYGSIGQALPTSNESITASAGDILLYASRYICIFWGANTYSYTRIGHIDGKSAAEIKEMFGGDKDIKLEIAD